MKISKTLKLGLSITLVTMFIGCGEENNGGGSTDDTGQNKVPIVNAGEDKTVNVNSSLTLSGIANDSDGVIVSYEWKKGTEVLATIASFLYQPTQIGTDILTFSATDDDGATVTDTLSIIVNETSSNNGDTQDNNQGTQNGKWITPSKSVCESNGGIYNHYGENQCSSYWEDALKICTASNSNLPTIEVLSSVITDCKGVINGSKNDENQFYQECYEKNGFSSLNQYWSSTSYTNADSDYPEYDDMFAWFIGFYLGDKKTRVKPTYYHVRCIKN